MTNPFQETYLKHLDNPLLNRCQLVDTVSLTDYNTLVGNKHNKITKLPSNQYIWGLLDTQTDKLVSVLHMTQINGCMLGADPGSHKILQWSYSYTTDSEEYRRKGLSTILRLASSFWAHGQGYHYINSVPLPGSESNNLLNNLGFTRCYDSVYDNDYCILDIRDKSKIHQLILSRLEKYN